MNAKEAREKALTITGDNEKKQYDAIQLVIGLAADEGKLKTHTYVPLFPSVKLKLEEEGYSISEFFDQRDGTTVTINW